ncbi:uncharacterized protein PFL1_02423 [Pseudozyma flocculosa PF-1]|uniref:uncharacterized protein n=1 Tax=Pseudozyma flocculosa PF-1 TaxID=1277687 RepID=UPI00045600D7|nr:uncharacterized protein PFL1_02423 [Pseudozyma flocculosa PF-1]EPQ30307.1 hypothetical protein PFL1_02423 [Pseudozyma flocculosa PF-1]
MESASSKLARPSLAGSSAGGSSGCRSAATAGPASPTAEQDRRSSASPAADVASPGKAPETQLPSMKAEHAASPRDEPEQKPETPVKRETSNEKPRGGQACLECRLAKVRCLPSADSDNCQRCQRFSFDCLFVQHKRGRKPKSKLQGRDLTLLAEAASATPASAMTPQHSAPARTNGSGADKQHEFATPSGRGKRSEAGTSAKGSGTTAAHPAASSPSSATQEAGRPNRLARRATLDRVPSTKSSPRFDVSFEDGARRPLSRLGAAAATGPEPPLDPRQLYGVDVTRMAKAMQQAMTDAGTPPPEDTNAINESFELIAEQPLTIRLMLKPFEVADGSPDDAPRAVFDDRVTIGASHAQQQREGLRVDDPITAGTLTEAAARALFERYMELGNTWSDVFDPSLMTNDFVRKRSSFLYTTLLYVASKFSRTPTAQHLVAREKRGEPVDEADQVRDHAARAFVDGDRTVLCCQAFFILASWKMLDDGLSVIQVGYAFRLAMDIQLHADMPNCVKPSESVLDQAGQQRYAAVQRRFRSRQRTFMMLFVQDKSQQIANKITTHSISPDNPLIRKCQEWWRMPGSVPGDAFVCASVDIRRIQHKYVDLMDRIEQLSGPMSDGPSIVLPAFLNDVAEWFQRWTSVLNVRKDLDEVAYGDDAAVNRAKFRRTAMKLWRDSLKTYVSSLALKWTLKKAAQLEHQELVRSHSRRSATAGTEERESVSGRSSIMQNGCVNLMTMNAFWPCVEGARGVLEALISFEPERLQTAPDATVLQSTHAAVLLCSLATLRSHPPLGQGYLRTTIELVDQTSAAFRRASISSDDTTFMIAQYLESLLRPKDARGDAATARPGARADEAAIGAPPLVAGQPVFGVGSSFYGAGGSGGGSGLDGPSSSSAAAAAGLRSNGWDAPTSMDQQHAAAAAASGYAAHHAGQHAPFFSHQHSSSGNNTVGGGMDGGLNTIAAAAEAVAAAASNGVGGPSAQMDIGNLTWPSTAAASSSAPATSAAGAGGAWSYADSYNWNSILFNQPPPPPPPPLQSTTGGQHHQQPTDETLQMLLRFLDG